MAELYLKLLTGLSMGPSLRGLPFIYYYLLIEILSMPQFAFPVDIVSFYQRWLLRRRLPALALWPKMSIYLGYLHGVWYLTRAQ